MLDMMSGTMMVGVIGADRGVGKDGKGKEEKRKRRKGRTGRRSPVTWTTGPVMRGSAVSLPHLYIVTA
jgi:hypothetical protein